MKKTSGNNTKTVENRMKGRFARFNKEAKWKYLHKDFEYKKLAEYLEETGAETIVVHGFYINETDLGESLSIIADDCMINLPSHAIDTFKELDNNANVELINAGALVLGNFTKKHVKRFNTDTIYFDLLDADEI